MTIKHSERSKYTSTSLSSYVPNTWQNSDFSKTQLFNSSANCTALPPMSSSMLDKITTSDSSSSIDVEQDLGKVVPYDIATNNNFNLLGELNFSESRASDEKNNAKEKIPKINLENYEPVFLDFLQNFKENISDSPKYPDVAMPSKWFK